MDMKRWKNSKACPGRRATPTGAHDKPVARAEGRRRSASAARAAKAPCSSPARPGASCRQSTTHAPCRSNQPACWESSRCPPVRTATWTSGRSARACRMAASMVAGTRRGSAPVRSRQTGPGQGPATPLPPGGPPAQARGRLPARAGVHIPDRRDCSRPSPARSASARGPTEVPAARVPPDVRRPASRRDGARPAAPGLHPPQVGTQLVDPLDGDRPSQGPKSFRRGPSRRMEAPVLGARISQRPPLRNGARSAARTMRGSLAQKGSIGREAGSSPRRPPLQALLDRSTKTGHGSHRFEGWIQLQRRVRPRVVDDFRDALQHSGRRQDKTFEEIQAELTDARTRGDQVVITGGEPTIRKDFRRS